MGQGFSLATPPAGMAGIDVPELADLVYEQSLGAARFMKTVRARHRNGVVLVKVLTKPYPMSLDKYKQDILRERQMLAGVRNALPYQRAIETETNGYLVRQFLYNSLYDRLSTRPFLEDIEKKWLAFQLLCALRDCHARNVYHGDIKTENTMVTSWNWLYLSDFSSSFKRVMLPEDNPADFSYFFDTSLRRTCYLAPERFLPNGQAADPDARITWAMDMFSAGCVIAELFLEAPVFTLAQLFRYRRGEYNPSISQLSRIPDKDLRDMIGHMIQLEPDRRYAARDYLDLYKAKVFPAYFYTFLHEYMGDITDGLTHSSSTGAARYLGEADQRIEHVWQDFDKISACLGHQQPQHDDDEQQRAVLALAPRLGLGHFPVRLNIPHSDHLVRVAKQPAVDDGTLIFLTLVSSSLRNTAHAAAKIKACDILLAFAERLTDEARLDRVLPYLMILVQDKCDLVVVSALRTIAQLLDLVTVLNPVNSQIFLEYILPRIQVALLGPNSNASPIVRATYASSLGKLATTASRYLDMAMTLRADGSAAIADPEVEPGNEADAAAFDGMFDSAQRDLINLVESHTKVLIEDPDPFVRRAFLTSVPDLCVFFGAAQANDIILTHLNTYLNDRDWTLKCAFFDTIIGISTFLGSSTLEKFILPLMIQAVADPEEYVVHGALQSLAELANLGLLSKPTFLELVGVIARFTMHPNIWVRESAAEFLAAGTTFQNPAFLRTLVLPLVEPYLKPHRLPDFSELALLDELQKPLSRSVFDQALLWATKTDKSNFWKPFRKLRDLTLGAPASGGQVAGGAAKVLSLSKVSKNEEDEQWLGKLRNLGLTAEDEAKLLVLREFIWRLSQIKSRDDANAHAAPPSTAHLDRIIPVKDLAGIRILTVFFDEEPVRPSTAASGPPDAGAPRTIKDALLDASMTIDDPVGKRRRAAQNNYRSRFSSRDAPSPTSPDGRRRTLDDGTIAISPTSGGGEGGVRKMLGSQSNETSGGTPPSDDGSSLLLLGVPDTPLSGERGLRHRSSAMSLMNRKDSAKTMPETSTTEANAAGEVEGPFVSSAAAAAAASRRRTLAGPEMAAREGSPRPTVGPPPRASHTYSGNDPSILRMLESMSVDNFPHDVHEFGPVVTPVHRRGQSSSPHPAGALLGHGQGKRDGWRPTGKLVATFAEHHGAINRIVVAPDHTFFLTGGDDGCVKIWDTMRLEKHITHKSRQTHRHATGARVMALCFVENTRCFVSCATDGSVHVVKVESSASHSGSGGGGGAGGGIGSGVAIGNTSSGLPRYNRLRLLREHRLDEGEWAVWCEHFRHDGLGSVLVLATNRSVVLGIDLRTMELAFRLENPVHHGTPTCFVVDRKRNWLVLGTSHGVLDLWDLRFKVRLRGWGVPGKGAIYRLSICPTKGRGRWACVAGGTGQGEVTVWDLEKKTCREIYRVGGSKEGPKGGGYEAWEVDDDRPGGMLGRFGAAEYMEPSGSGNADRGVRAMVVGISPSPSDGGRYDGGGNDQVVSESANNNNPWQRDVRNAYLITAGSDKKLRFWDLARVENSVVFSGLQADEARPTFASSHPLANLTLNVERGARQSKSDGGSSGGDASGRKDRKTGGGGGGSANGNRPPRSTVISLQQQQLLRSHLDAIVDVAVLELPYMMTVSADRSGVVFVFQ